MPQARYEVQSYDCHVLNPEYALDGPSSSVATGGGGAAAGGTGTARDNKNMSIILTVSGYVRYGEARDAAMRGFSDNFVLVPHPENHLGSASGRARDKGALKREWVIQSQNFRLVV